MYFYMYLNELRERYTSFALYGYQDTVILQLSVGSLGKPLQTPHTYLEGRRRQAI